MGHGIERIVEDGVEVDCFSYVGERPWHGLGQRLERPDLQEIEQAARADWSVVTDAVVTSRDGRQLDGVAAIVRDRDGRALGAVSDRYAILQHRALGELIDLLVKAGRARWESVGVLDDGVRIFYSAQLHARLEPIRGDDTVLYAVATTAHDGSSTGTLTLSTTRVVCKNTLAVAMSKAVDRISIRHSGDLDAGLRRAKEIVLGIDGRVREMGEAFDVLTHTTLNEAQSTRFLQLVHPAPALPAAEVFAALPNEKRERLLYGREHAVRVQEKIRELHETHVGQDIARRGTGYAWIQAVSAYSTHVMRSSSKVASMLVGDAAKLGRHALALLTDSNTRQDILSVAA